MLVILLAQRYRKAANFDEWFSVALMLCQVCVVACLFVSHTGVAAWYGIVCIGKGRVCLMAFDSHLEVGLWAVMSRPKYTGPQDVQMLTAATFNRQIAYAATKESQTWVVLFTASWSKDCDHFIPTFSDLSVKYARQAPRCLRPQLTRSIRYSTDRMRFASVDVSVAPELAEKFNIDTGGT